jgi:hypothetical protein
MNLGTKRKVAIWYVHDKLYVVKLPGWENRVDLTFTSRNAMKAWAESENLILKDGSKQKEAT